MVRLYIFLTLSLITVAFLSCGTDAPTETEQGSRISFYLTDIPAVYDSVNISFSEVGAHIDSQWVYVQVETTTVNLLEYSNGKLFALGGINVQPGKYTQTRIKIDDAEIGVDGQVFPLDVPSGAQTGLKFGPQFTIEEGIEYKIIIDFDAQQSIVTTGPPFTPSGYKLKPHIRVNVEGVNGSISGTVSNPAHLPAAYAVLGVDTVNTTMVDKDSGNFLLGFLDAGTYTVIISDTLEQQFTTSTEVIQGENSPLGIVELQ